MLTVSVALERETRNAGTALIILILACCLAICWLGIGASQPLSLCHFQRDSNFNVKQRQSQYAADGREGP